jgi:glycosyltransferase involved in cell wall biosynthesis
MRVAYANAFYDANAFTGRNVHVKQFTDHATALGHEIWTWPRDQYSGAKHLPRARLQRLLVLRRMDVIYTRLEDDAPDDLHFSTGLYRQLSGSPIIVWEFNVAPEYGAVIGRSREEIERAISSLKAHSKGCDLAVCVSDALADYVRQNFAVKRVVTVPNGSDPHMFRPDVQPVRRIERCPDRLNVVWIGSADLSYNNFDLLRKTAELLGAHIDGERIRFHIIGKGLKRLRDMPATVSYHGPEDYEAMPGWLAAMDVGLCLYRPGPSDYCSPLKLYDYMASGLAVVSNHQPQVNQVFEQLAQTDLLFRADDAAALAAILRKLAADRDRVRRLGEAGRRLVIDYYNWRRTAEHTFREIAALREMTTR